MLSYIEKNALAVCTAVMALGSPVMAQKAVRKVASRPLVKFFSIKDVQAAALVAGLTVKGGHVFNDCDEELKRLEQKDLNGDGQPELIFGDAGLCSGNVGWFIVLTRTAAGPWRKILTGDGIYELLATRRQGWRNIETGGPGCEGSDPTYGWSGTKYVVMSSKRRSCTGNLGTDGAEAALPVAPANPMLPATVSYAGPTTYKDVSTVLDLELTHANGVLSGYSAGQLFGRLWTTPVNGAYAAGICTVKLRSDSLVGPCDARGFKGQRLSKKGSVVGSFDFTNTADLPAVARQDRPPPAAGARQSYASQGGIGTVWALGRARILVRRAQRCGPASSLGKSYCFDDAIGWLQAHPSKSEIDVIAMDVAYLPGQMVPYNSGQGWDVYRVSRRGDGFAADKQRHFATKISVPQGCIYNGVVEEAWYLPVLAGRSITIEAARYACANLAGGVRFDRSQLDPGDLDFDPRAVAFSASSISNLASADASGQPAPQFARQTPSDDGTGDILNAMPNASYGGSKEIYGTPGGSGSKPSPRRKRK